MKAAFAVLCSFVLGILVTVVMSFYYLHYQHYYMLVPRAEVQEIFKYIEYLEDQIHQHGWTPSNAHT